MGTLNTRLIVAFILALALTILPLPELLVGIRPPWVLLLVLYLQYYIPERFNVSMIFITGLLMDVLLSTVIGEHAFALTLVSWVASSKARRFYFFSIGQQMGLIAVFSLLYQLTILAIDAFSGFYISFISAIGSTVASVVIWPWVRLIAEDTLLVKLPFRR